MFLLINFNSSFSAEEAFGLDIEITKFHADYVHFAMFDQLTSIESAKISRFNILCFFQISVDETRGKYNRPVSCPVLALITSISRADRRLSLERLFHILEPFAHSRTLALSLSGENVIKGHTSARKDEIGNDFLVGFSSFSREQSLTSKEVIKRKVSVTLN